MLIFQILNLLNQIENQCDRILWSDFIFFCVKFTVKIRITSEIKNFLLFIFKMCSPRDGALIGWLTAPSSPPPLIAFVFSAIEDVVALMVDVDGLGVV